MYQEHDPSRKAAMEQQEQERQKSAKMGLINIIVVAGGQTGREVQEDESEKVCGKRRALMTEDR